MSWFCPCMFLSQRETPALLLLLCVLCGRKKILKARKGEREGANFLEIGCKQSEKDTQEVAAALRCQGLLYWGHHSRPGTTKPSRHGFILCK